MQTEQMVRVEMKKDQIAELWEGIHPTGQPDENYHFLPVSWLTDTLKDWGDVPTIDTTSLLCRHGKLNWSLPHKYKVVAEAKVRVGCVALRVWNSAALLLSMAA